MSDEDYDPGLHAAQFQMFFIVKCVNKQLADGGDFFWFGVPFFDNRHAIPLPYRAKDVGKDDATGKFIYTIDGREILTGPMKIGKWVQVEKDLLPFVKAGLAEAVVRGYLENGEPGNYAVVNMNMGWEMPGVFDGGMQVRGLKVGVVLGGEDR